MSTTIKRKVLLVHGSGHESSCWNLLTPYLSQHHNTEVHTVTLSGHGKNFCNPFRVSMKTYIKDVCDKAQSLGGHITLIGHSMGGAVISMAAEARPDLFNHLIYIAADVPHISGRSMFAEREDHQQIVTDIVKTRLSKGIMFYCPNGAPQVFYNNCTVEIQSWASQNLSVQPIRPIFSKLNWSQQRLGKIRKSYIECTQDRALKIELQREMQSRMRFNDICTLDTDHSPFLSMPKPLAQTISQLG